MDLTEIGLTKNESKVFETLVKIGKSGSSTISKESGVSYSRIYDVLASLEHKGLVKVIPEKGKKFVPSDPKILKNLIEKKKRSLETLNKEINRLKKIYEIKEKEPVQIAKGKRNFYKLERELPRPKKLEFNIKYTAEYKPVWEREYKKYLRKRIELKELVRVDKKTIKNVKKWLKIHKNIKEIPNEGVAISIRDDSAILISLIKSNVSILIKDTPFVNLMKELFRKYYEQTTEPKALYRS
jgi:sugar-specific transcriptional regulator TrmB